MSILPTFAQVTITSQDAVQQDTSRSMREYGVDFSTGQMTGQIVDGKEAVKVWIWKCLLTERFRYAIYSWIYGSELERYIGQALTDEYVKTDVRLALEDALLINPEIKEITHFSGTIDGDTLRISFTVQTDFGEVSILDYDLDAYKTLAQRNLEKVLKYLMSGIVRFSFDRNGHLVLAYSNGIRSMLTFALRDGHLVANVNPALLSELAFEIDRSTGRLEATGV